MTGNRTHDKWERWTEKRVRGYVYTQTKREIGKYLMITFCAACSCKNHKKEMVENRTATMSGYGKYKVKGLVYI